RFLTIAGKTDKGKALHWLRHYYQSRFNNNTAQSEAIRIIALGDSPNDESMLNAADIAVIIRSQKSSQLSVTRPKEIIYSEEPGSKGWCSAIIALLEEK
ncbi:MAG: HAD family hydrolase, partial [Porticoccaceae bacterium]